MKAEIDQTIWRDGPLRLELRHVPGDAWLDYVANVQFGPADRRYKRRQIREQIRRFVDPLFLSLNYSGRIVGSYLLDFQPLRVARQPWLGIYRGLLSVDEAFRERKLGTAVVAATLEWIDSFAAAESRPVLTYGCVDAGNTPSLKILEDHGMSRLARLATKLIYRQFVRKRLLPAQLQSGLSVPAEHALKAQYDDNVITEATLNAMEWVTIEDERHSPFAARVVTNELNLAPMTGLAGFVTEKLLPWFPPGRRRFNPRRFRYVSVSEPVVAADNIVLWPRLIEHLMVEHGCHFVSLTVNKSSAAYPLLFDQADACRAEDNDILVVGKAVNATLPPGSIARLTARDW